jgi:hypothetical protein
VLGEGRVGRCGGGGGGEIVYCITPVRGQQEESTQLGRTWQMARWRLGLPGSFLKRDMSNSSGPRHAACPKPSRTILTIYSYDRT